MAQTSIKELIDGFTYAKFGLDENEQYNISKTKAIDLLTPNRLDLVAKYMYLFFKHNHIKSNLAEEVYKNHIEIFSEGKFYEPGSDTKKTYDDFIKEYDQIYKDIKKNGFNAEKSLIPIGNDGVIINGGHRTATAIFLNKEVTTLEIHNHPGPHFDYKYFERGRMPREYLDFLALNYVKLTPKPTFAICLWPRAVSMNKTKECEALIAENTSIIYKKVLPLSKIGLKDLMMHLYHNEKWVGPEKSNFMGVYGKLDVCYAESDTIIYFVEAKNLATIIDLKNQIRSIFGIDKHSVHITDTENETYLAADLVLNPNGLLALNCGYPDKLNPKLDSLRNKTNGLKSQKVILGPSYTLQYFGYDIKIKGDDFRDINSLTRDVVFDTRNFFFYRGFKLFSPEYAKELSDGKHANLFDAIINMKKLSTKAKIKESLAKAKYLAKRRLRSALRKAGLLEYIRNIRKRNHE